MGLFHRYSHGFRCGLPMSVSTTRCDTGFYGVKAFWHERIHTQAAQEEIWFLLGKAL